MLENFNRWQCINVIKCCRDHLEKWENEFRLRVVPWPEWAKPLPGEYRSAVVQEVDSGKLFAQGVPLDKWAFAYRELKKPDAASAN